MLTLGHRMLNKVMAAIAMTSANGAVEVEWTAEFVDPEPCPWED
jgi:hypothetical protein